MNKRVLLVDDDANILAGYKRQMRKVFEIETAPGGDEALEIMGGNELFAVVCSDLRMPEMDGLAFLTRAREKCPDTVRMMLTGNADIQSAIESVNEGNIFRFLTKPCEPAVLARAIADGIKQHNLVIGERELLNKTLRGSIKIMTDVLALVNQQAFGRASRIADYVREIVAHLNLESPWEYETAAMLSQIGCITLPAEIIDKVSKGRPLAQEEQSLYEEHPLIASDLLSNLPRLEKISEMVKFQNRSPAESESNMAAGSDRSVNLGSRILKAVIDLDTLISSGLSKGRALLNLKSVPDEYDQSVLSALEWVLGTEAKYDVLSVTVRELRENMIVAEDVVPQNDNRVLVTKGQRLSSTMIRYILNFNRIYGVNSPIRVFMPL